MKIEIELSEKDIEDMLTQYLSARNIVVKNAKDIAKRMAKGMRDTKVEAEEPRCIIYPSYPLTYPSYPWVSDHTVYGNGGGGAVDLLQPARIDGTGINPNLGQTEGTCSFSTSTAGPGPINPSDGFGYDSEGTYTRAANE
jgi:hypothetical protein